MKGLIAFTTIFVLTIVFIVPGILAIPIHFVPYNDQPGYSVDYRRGIYAQNTVVQYFTSQEDNLSGFGLSVGNANLKNKEDIILKLYEEGGNQLVRSTTLNGQNIEDGSLVRFLFDPVTGSKGKTYFFVLASPDTHDFPFSIFFTDRVPSWVGDTYFEEGKVFEEGKLAFVTYHKPASKLQLIKDIYASWLGRLVGKGN